MVKVGRISIAIVLGVVMSLSLLTVGVSARSVSPGEINQATHVFVPTTMLQGVNQTIQASRASWQIVCARGYRSIYQGGRWVCIR